VYRDTREKSRLNKIKNKEAYEYIEGSFFQKNYTPLVEKIRDGHYLTSSKIRCNFINACKAFSV